MRPKALMRLSTPKKPVSRGYGGPACAECVCNRTQRAFPTEDWKISVKVSKAQAQSRKAKCKNEAFLSSKSKYKKKKRKKAKRE